MSTQDKAEDILRRNKIEIQDALCADYRLILNKVYAKKLITISEYKNLKSIDKEDVEGHVNELVDKIMFKGEKRCQAFLDLLQTDELIKETYPQLEDLQLNTSGLLPVPVQASSSSSPDSNENKPPKRQNQDYLYQLDSRPVGLCVIINNENFYPLTSFRRRRGTDRDAESLAEVFSWLGFRVLMCEDQTSDQMVQTLTCLASLSDSSQLQQLNIKEWSEGCFKDFQGAAKHSDAFICCILSHGSNEGVFGVDGQPLSLQDITRTFKTTDESALKGKPKVFLMACEGEQLRSVKETDILVALASVGDRVSYRHVTDGTWFIQSLCKQLKELCPRGEDITFILHSVISEISLKEVPSRHEKMQQLPGFTSTLRKKLVFSPHHT
ncbi:caspase-8-like [Halichoeres trimaculatus]|uniref:caspase-8-like n=1 Tax=Halichoeres trimaculatus TaxID=147232 RepID=UPI003D9E41A3